MIELKLVLKVAVATALATWLSLALGQDNLDANACRGCFLGELQLAANAADPTGATKVLLQDLFFVDADGTVWKAGKGDITDGASIPPLLQPIIGGPWENDYLPAAVIHDHYTNDAHKVRPWRDTALVLYQAMLVEHVDVIKAKTMYYAVYAFGPHWDKLAQGVNCGPGCVFSPDFGLHFRPADYAVSHSDELALVERDIRQAELQGKPLSLDDIGALALARHANDPFIASPSK